MSTRTSTPTGTARALLVEIACYVAAVVSLIVGSFGSTTSQLVGFGAAVTFAVFAVIVFNNAQRKRNDAPPAAE